MERSSEFEILRHGLATLPAGANASLPREEPVRAITELADVEARLKRLRAELRRFANEQQGVP